MTSERAHINERLAEKAMSDIDPNEPRPDEKVGEYIARLQRRIVELEPPKGFTMPEWQIGQVLAMGLMPFDSAVSDEAIIAFRDAMKARFPEQVEKFAKYMGWGQHPKKPSA